MVDALRELGQALAPARDAEVLRMPAGSNPSWLSPEQYAAVLAHLPPHPGAALGPWPV